MTEDDSSMAYSADPLEDYSLSWQASEIEQKVLDSARCLWERSVQQNIRDAVRSFSEINLSGNFV